MLAPSHGVGFIMPSSMVSPAKEEKIIEDILKEKIASIRKNDESLATTFDSHLGYLLSTALANYEFERVSGGVTFGNDEF